MKQILHKPETSGRLIKWAIEPSEFDIKYKPNINKMAYLRRFHHGIHPSKAYRSYPIDTRPLHLEVVHGPNAQGSCAGLILTSLYGIDVEYTLRFGFQASNNEAEYEVVIARLNLAYSMEADQLEVSSDSQLVVKQIEDSYEARGEKMIL